MRKQVAEAINLPYRETDLIVIQLVDRVIAKMPEGMTPDADGFAEAARAAEAQVNAEGDMAIVALVKAITAPAPERVYKIKPTLKGARIKIAAANGIRYSFGPTWNDSVKRGKGIALVEANREKLNHQATMFGIADPAEMDAGALCTALAEKL